MGRSRRQLVDIVTIAGNATHSHFSSRIAKMRSCCLHLCSISLRMCPTSSNIDPSGRLMCPKSHLNAKSTRTSGLPQPNSCLSKVTVAGCLPDEVQQELQCGLSCAHRTTFFLGKFAFVNTKVSPREVIGHMKPVRCRKFLYVCESMSSALLKLTSAMGHCLVWTPNSWHSWCQTCLSDRLRCQLFELASTL